MPIWTARSEYLRLNRTTASTARPVMLALKLQQQIQQILRNYVGCYATRCRQQMRLIHHCHLFSLLSVSEGYLALRQSFTKSNHVHSSSCAWMTRKHVHSQASTESLLTLDGFSVAIVGAGPAGLVLAHQLAQAGATALHVFEQRPKYDSAAADSSRAYAHSNEPNFGREWSDPLATKAIGLYCTHQLPGFSSVYETIAEDYVLQFYGT